MPAENPPPTEPSTAELIEALGAPGPLYSQPAVQRLLQCRAEKEQKQRPQLRLIRGGRDAG